MNKDNTVQEFVWLLCAMVIACGIYFGLKAMPTPARYQLSSGQHGVFKLDATSGHVWRYYRAEDGNEGFLLLRSEGRTEADWTTSLEESTKKFGLNK